MAIFSTTPKTMRIKLLSSLCGMLPAAGGRPPREFGYAAGAEIDWDAAEARRMIDKGIAAEVSK